MKKLTLVILLGLLPFFKGKTQEQITDFLYGLTAGTLNDTEQLIEGYMSPVGAWFGNGLNAGWYNTGKPHQFPGFDVTVGFHIITPPTDALYFSPTLESFMIDGDGELATILGPSDPTQVMYTNPINEQNENLFKIPGGLNWDGALLMPYLQGSIGLIKKTEILFRYAPRVSLKELETGFWGIGMKHDVKQWIPGVKILPFDLSVLMGYSKLNSGFNFSRDDQNLNFDVKAFNSNLILSKKLSIFTPYVGIGYQYSQATLALNGTYTIYDWNETLGVVEEGVNLEVTDPFNFSFGGVNGFKATMGARIKLLLFTIHVDWTKAEYDMFTIGIGLNSDIGSKLIGGTIDKTISE